MTMSIQLLGHQLRRILSDAKEEDLIKELFKRVTSREKGNCDHCHRPLNSEPVCSIQYRHEGRKPMDWEGICDTPRISEDRTFMSYCRDDGSSVGRSRFPCNCYSEDVLSGDHPRSIGRDRPCLDHTISYNSTKVHIACDGEGCDYKYCDNGFVMKTIDFGDDLKSKWPEEVISFTVVPKEKPEKKLKKKAPRKRKTK